MSLHFEIFPVSLLLSCQFPWKLVHFGLFPNSLVEQKIFHFRKLGVFFSFTFVPHYLLGELLLYVTPSACIHEETQRFYFFPSTSVFNERRTCVAFGSQAVASIMNISSQASVSRGNQCCHC